MNLISKITNTKMGIAFSIFDLALTFALIAFILWILAITAVLPIEGNIIHVFLIIAIILLVVWLIFRVFNMGGYNDRFGRRNQMIV